MQIIISDLENTCGEGWHPLYDAPGQAREAIQVAGLIFDWEAPLLEMPYFDSYAKPVINPKLTAYCSKLTGISQNDVDGADSAQAVFNCFHAFIGNCNVLSYGNDRNIVATTAGLQNFAAPFNFNKWGSLRDSIQHALEDELGRTVDWSQYSSGTIHTLLEIPMEGDVHNGLHDCFSLAATLQELHKRGHQNLLPTLPQLAT